MGVLNIDDLKGGMVLADDIFNKHGNILIKKGNTLSKQNIMPLKAWGVTEVKKPEEVFASGLLHDIGKLVLIMNSPEEFFKVIDEVQGGGSSFVEAEQKMLGFNHTQISKALAEKWDFPPETVDMIVYHHYPELSGNISKEIAAIHLGNILSIALSLGSSGEKMPSPI